MRPLDFPSASAATAILDRLLAQAEIIQITDPPGRSYIQPKNGAKPAS
jgi:hypothetical protein